MKIKEFEVGHYFKYKGNIYQITDTYYDNHLIEWRVNLCSSNRDNSYTFFTGKQGNDDSSEYGITFVDERCLAMI